jgi:hypothetical protein
VQFVIAIVLMVQADLISNERVPLHFVRDHGNPKPSPGGRAGMSKDCQSGVLESVAER